MLIHTSRGEQVPIEQSRVLEAALEKADQPPNTLWQSYDWTWDTEESNEILAVQQAIAFLQSRL